jgi:hypothetical protein
MSDHDRRRAPRRGGVDQFRGGDLVSKRFAFYGRLSTTDKQDPALKRAVRCERPA